MALNGTELVSWMLQVVLAYGAAVLTFLGVAPTKLGEKFLGHLLERKLSTLRHEQDEKLEALKEQLAHLGDRAKRSNEREFEALASIWTRFVEAYLSAQACAHAFTSHPDLTQMSAEDLQTFLQGTELADLQKKHVLDASDRNRAFARMLKMRSINKARDDIFDARLRLRTNGIFVPAELSAQFSSALEVLSKAQVQRYIESERDEGSYGGKEVEFLIINGERIFSELTTAVRMRLLR
jgi:hypothetical protein